MCPEVTFFLRDPRVTCFLNWASVSVQIDKTQQCGSILKDKSVNSIFTFNICYAVVYRYQHSYNLNTQIVKKKYKSFLSYLQYSH